MKVFPGISVLFAFLLIACEQEPKTPTNSDETPKPLETTNTAGKANNAGLSEDYTNTNRVIWQKPDMIINLLGELEDKVVADIGAGTGFFSLRLTPKSKKVIAIDIDPRFINYLDSVKVLELPENLQGRLETRLGKYDDPLLKNDETNVVVIVNTYMYIKDRIKYLQTLFQGVAPGGKILIVDFKRKRTPIGPPSDARIPLFQVEEELEDAGFTNISTNDTALDYQYFVMAEKPMG